MLIGAAISKSVGCDKNIFLDFRHIAMISLSGKSTLMPALGPPLRAVERNIR